MQIPSIQQFNNWSFKEKLRWIDSETYGKYKEMRRDQGYFPLLVYDKQNVGIVYSVNSKGDLYSADAMTVAEAFNRLLQFKSASEAVVAASKVS